MNDGPSILRRLEASLVSDTPAPAAGSGARLRSLAERLQFDPELESYVPSGFGHAYLTYFRDPAAAPLSELMRALGEVAGAGGSVEIWTANLRPECTGNLASDVAELASFSVELWESLLAGQEAPAEDIEIRLLRPWWIDLEADQSPRVQSVATDSRGSWLLVNGVNGGFEPCGMLAFTDPQNAALAQSREFLAEMSSDWRSESEAYRLVFPDDEGERALFAERGEKMRRVLAKVGMSA